MKRIALTVLAATLTTLWCLSPRMTAAQEQPAEGQPPSTLQVIDPDTARQLAELASRLDTTDPTTERLGTLLNSPSGMIAVAGYLNELRGRSREQARADAIPRFIDHHFTQDAQGKWAVRPESAEAVQRWAAQSERLSGRLGKMTRTCDEIAEQLDTTTEAGGLLDRLLKDPQAPAAVLIGRMQGGDAITRLLSEALQRLLVDQGDGVFRIVDSQRRQATEQLDRFERADQICQRLRRELPALGAEYSAEDQPHRDLIAYLANPLTASVVALEMSEKDTAPAEAIDRLRQHFEAASVDTPTGLKINDKEAWDKLKEVFSRVDRVGNVLPQVQQQLADVAETLAADDPLAARLAAQMKREPLAVLLASELPYAEADPGEELKTLLSEVLNQADGKLSVRPEREEEVAAKARELLQDCRNLRRYLGELDDALAQLADDQLREKLGQTGRYTILEEVRRLAEQHRPDPIALLQADLLVVSDAGQLQVRQEQREIVRRLVEQSEKVNAEAANDDF
jgi:hypothetical protein